MVATVMLLLVQYVAIRLIQSYFMQLCGWNKELKVIANMKKNCN